MEKMNVPYYEKQDYLLFVIGSLLFNEHNKIADIRIRDSIEKIVTALDIGDLKDKSVFHYIFNELMTLGVNNKNLEWDVSSMINWCKDFNENIHYPITYGDKVNGKDVNIEGLVDGTEFWNFILREWA